MRRMQAHNYAHAKVAEAKAKQREAQMAWELASRTVEVSVAEAELEAQRLADLEAAMSPRGSERLREVESPQEQKG